MKFLASILILLLTPLFTIAQSVHQALGTDYSSHGAQAYATMKHGVDGVIFLDPYFLPFLENIQGFNFLDAGCGAGPWSIIAAQNGALVCGIDIQENMISLAKKAAQNSNIMDRVFFDIGSVSCLPYDDNSFDRAISINVGCNLPPSVFSDHFKELFRTLKPEGTAIITAPASFGALFTTNKATSPLNTQIANELEHISATDNEQIRTILKSFDQILRATFVIRNEKLTLVADEKGLIEGEAIWRKIPGLAVPNFYHSEEKYLEEILNAGFIIERIDRPRFQSYTEWLSDNRGLAKEYCYFHAFTIYHISKPSQ